MFKFQRLKVWEKAVDFSSKVFVIANKLERKYQYSFGDQLRRAVLSISNNIAEGSGRRGRKESSQFFNIAKGSTYEVVNMIIIINQMKLIDFESKEISNLSEEADEICRMLGGLMKKS